MKSLQNSINESIINEFDSLFGSSEEAEFLSEITHTLIAWINNNKNKKIDTKQCFERLANSDKYFAKRYKKQLAEFLEEKGKSYDALIELLEAMQKLVKYI